MCQLNWYYAFKEVMCNCALKYVTDDRLEAWIGKDATLLFYIITFISSLLEYVLCAILLVHMLD